MPIFKVLKSANFRSSNIQKMSEWLPKPVIHNGWRKIKFYVFHTSNNYFNHKVTHLGQHLKPSQFSETFPKIFNFWIIGVFALRNSHHSKNFSHLKRLFFFKYPDLNFQLELPNSRRYGKLTSLYEQLILQALPNTLSISITL